MLLAQLCRLMRLWTTSCASEKRRGTCQWSGTSHFLSLCSGEQVVFLGSLPDMHCIVPSHIKETCTSGVYICISCHLIRHCLACRYKSEIRAEDKDALRQLIKEQYHYQVTPEIHRELDASRYGRHC